MGVVLPSVQSSMDGYRTSGVEVGVGDHISGSPDAAWSKLHVSKIFHFYLIFFSLGNSGDFPAIIYFI